MATVTVTEFAGVTPLAGALNIQAAVLPALRTTVLTTAGTAAPLALLAGTGLIRVYTEDAGVTLVMGGVATATSMPLAAGASEYFGKAGAVGALSVYAAA